MNRCTIGLAIACAATALAMPSTAAGGGDLLKDLGAVIALLGLPCGQVVSATRTNDNDHTATCSDGHRYRVFINATGRVVAEPV